MSRGIGKKIYRSFSARLGVLAIAIGVGCPRVSRGDNWLNAAGGTFSAASNWSDGAPPPGYPAGFGSAVFSLGAAAPYTVVLDSGYNAAITVQNDQPTIDFEGQSIINANTPAPIVTSTAGQFSNLNFSNGTLNTSFGWAIGGTGGTSGLALNSFTAIIVHSGLTVGGPAGSISNYNQSGGELRALLGCSFGTGAGTTNVSINGGKAWTQPTMSFGTAGTLNAQLESTAVYSSYENVDIASGPATSTVMADSSTLSANGLLLIGTGVDPGPSGNPLNFSVMGGGTGKLIATNSIVNASTGAIIGTSGGSGTFNVSGTGSLVTLGSASFTGYGGTGTVNVSGGAKLKTGDMYVGSNGGNGTVIISGTGSNWTMAGGVTGNATIGSYNGSAGVGLVELDHSATWNLSTGLVGFGSTSGGNVNLIGNAALQILSAARVNAIGFNQSAGSTLEIGLDSPANASNGQLDLSGTAALAGTLDVVLENGFQPTVGEQFQLMNFAGESGQFFSVNLPTPYAWDTSKLYTQGIVSVTAVPEPGSFGLLVCAGIVWRRRCSV